MNKPLPEVSCQKCYLVQIWRNQKDCVQCGARLNNWHVASQLKAQEAQREAV